VFNLGLPTLDLTETSFFVGDLLSSAFSSNDSAPSLTPPELGSEPGSSPAPSLGISSDSGDAASPVLNYPQPEPNPPTPPEEPTAPSTGSEPDPGSTQQPAPEPNSPSSGDNDDHGGGHE
jgi:hypothetical protein